MKTTTTDFQAAGGGIDTPVRFVLDGCDVCWLDGRSDDNEAVGSCVMVAEPAGREHRNDQWYESDVAAATLDEAHELAYDMIEHMRADRRGDFDE